MRMGKETRLILFTVMTAVVAFGLAATTGVAWAQGETESSLDTIVVTGNPEGEDRFRSPSTILVIDQETIKKTNAASITDLLSTTAVGYMSRSSPGYTNINIRGGLGDMVDSKSWTMVLVNGRRAGTSNLSKLSPNDIYRIEVMRGPSSVRYGSQAIGGIVNIILKTGRNTEGGLIDARIGSSGLMRTHAEHATTWGETGAVATYIGGSWSKKDDYEAGKGGGTQTNTHWKRRGGVAAVDWQINENNALHVNFRSDKTYDVGFRGSGINLDAGDDRLSQSTDLMWDFDSPDLPIKWRLHGYMVYDEDHFQWHNYQRNMLVNESLGRKYIMGLKFQPTIQLSDVNTLALGVDFEHFKFDSKRDYVELDGTVVLRAPLNANQVDEVLAFYVEDTHQFFDDRLIVRGGVRYTMGETTLMPTPNTDTKMASVDYKHLTWSVGANFAATDNLSFRLGAATGFRAPTAAELAGSSTVMNFPNDITFGNPDLKPETSLQYEVGMFVRGEGWYFDAALFHNEITDEIRGTGMKVVETLPVRIRHANYINREESYTIRGFEFDSRIDVEDMTDMGNWQLAFGLRGTYNFELQSEQLADDPRYNTDNMTGVYEFQGAFYTQFGKDDTASLPWSVRLTGTLFGPYYLQSEEALSVPEIEPHADYIHKKDSFMVWDLNGEVQLSQQWAVYGGISNLFNKNQHTNYVSIDDGTKWRDKSNPEGQYGTSMPGREFYLGLKFTF